MSSGVEGPGSEVFAEIARSLLAEPDVQKTLQKIVDLAVETIDGCDHAGITFSHGRNLSTPTASDDVPLAVDLIQYEAGEGPCLDAIREHEVFWTGDLSKEERWPTFANGAHRATGVTSMMGFRLFVASDTLGSLNLYSKRPDAFDEDARAVGAVFAAHAAMALSTARHDEQMDQALASRDLIGQAKGILMAKQGVTADEAFEILRRGSQRLNVKLVKLAEDLITRAGATQESLPTTEDLAQERVQPGA